MSENIKVDEQEGREMTDTELIDILKVALKDYRDKLTVINADREREINNAINRYSDVVKFSDMYLNEIYVNQLRSYFDKQTKITDELILKALDLTE